MLATSRLSWYIPVSSCRFCWSPNEELLGSQRKSKFRGSNFSLFSLPSTLIAWPSLSFARACYGAALPVQSYGHIISAGALEWRRNLSCCSSDAKAITWLHPQTLMISLWMPKRRRAWWISTCMRLSWGSGSEPKLTVLRSWTRFSLL